PKRRQIICRANSLTDSPVSTNGIPRTSWNTSRNTKEIQNSSAEEEPYEQESGEGAADMSVSWPYLCLGVRGHGALLFGQPRLSSHSYSRRSHSKPRRCCECSGN